VLPPRSAGCASHGCPRSGERAVTTEAALGRRKYRRNREPPAWALNGPLGRAGWWQPVRREVHPVEAGTTRVRRWRWSRRRGSAPPGRPPPRDCRAVLRRPGRPTVPRCRPVPGRGSRARVRRCGERPSATPFRRRPRLEYRLPGPDPMICHRGCDPLGSAASMEGAGAGHEPGDAARGRHCAEDHDERAGQAWHSQYLGTPAGSRGGHGRRRPSARTCSGVGAGFSGAEGTRMRRETRKVTGIAPTAASGATRESMPSTETSR
jgi:hypothetical protein